MAWFRTQENTQRPLVVALEGISPDLLQVQLSMLEQELHTAGVVVRRLAFPTQKAAEHVPALFQAPELTSAPQSLGIIASLDRAMWAVGHQEATPDKELILLTGGPLYTAAWAGSLLEESAERVALYRWLDDLEYGVFHGRRIDLTVFVDMLPEHIDIHEQVWCPAGWGDRPAPELEQLRTAYVEAANLFPKTKIVSASREGLLKPDSDIGNEVWNLVRRIVLKTDIPQR